jgi:hypothetical protein
MVVNDMEAFIKKLNEWVNNNTDNEICDVVKYLSNEMKKEHDVDKIKRYKNSIILMLRGQTNDEGEALICSCGTFSELAHGNKKNFLRRGE